MLTLLLLEMLMISLLSFGEKTQKNGLPQKQNQKRHRKSPESLLLAMIILMLVLRRRKSEDVNLSIKLDQRMAWM